MLLTLFELTIYLGGFNLFVELPPKWSYTFSIIEKGIQFEEGPF